MPHQVRARVTRLGGVHRAPPGCRRRGSAGRGPAGERRRRPELGGPLRPGHRRRRRRRRVDGRPPSWSRRPGADAPTRARPACPARKCGGGVVGPPRLGSSPWPTIKPSSTPAGWSSGSATSPRSTASTSTCSAGEAFGFLGPNGAGKSSTMRMIGCVSPPTAGDAAHPRAWTRAATARRSGPGSASARSRTTSTPS